MPDPDSNQISQEKAARNLYDVPDGRLFELINDPAAATLEAETAMQRRLLELWYQKCEDENSLLSDHKTIANLIDGVRSMVTANHALQKSRGGYLDATQALVLAETFLKSVTQHAESLIPEEATRKEFIKRVGKDILEATKGALQ